MRIARVRKRHGVIGWVAAERGDAWRSTADPFRETVSPVGPVVDVAEFLAPVLPTSQIIGLTRLHGDVRPVQAWLKNPRGTTGHGATIPARHDNGRVHAEGELAAIIGRPSRDAAPEAVLDHLLGWTIANDVTDADQAAIDPRVFQAKHAVGYTPLGPWIETEPGDPDRLDVRIDLGGAVAASVTTAAFHEPMREALAYVARWMDLEPGDVVLTGWGGPAVPVVAGDTVTIECEGIGRLTNPVR